MPSYRSASSSDIPKLAWALTNQSFVKQFLTEADKLIVSRISPIEDQGGYGLALNYGKRMAQFIDTVFTDEKRVTGSLVARVLFQPLEESSRLFYSREAGSIRASPDEKVAAAADGRKSIQNSTKLLEQLVKLQIYLTLIFTCFCPFYSTPLLYHLLRGSRWMSTSAPRLLQEYLFLLPLLGFNGVLEAFVQATANEQQLGRMSRALLGWSAIYCTCCYIAVTFFGLKEDALLLANGVTMACRIAYSTGFIDQFCQKHGGSFSIGSIVWQSRLPAAASILATFVLSWSKDHFDWTSLRGLLLHIGVGASCFVICLVLG